MYHGAAAILPVLRPAGMELVHHNAAGPDTDDTGCRRQGGGGVRAGRLLGHQHGADPVAGKKRL
jgi:hypothetical protein